MAKKPPQNNNTATGATHPPRAIAQAMVSSTFTDLKEHRAALIAAIHKHKLHANVMEHDDAKASGDVIDSSLRMVRESAAYVLLIGFKYGQTPQDAERNREQLSITELEYNEALQLGRPTLLFIMGEKHPVLISDIEEDPVKKVKLAAFRERAKIKTPGTSVHRVFSVFNSLEDFKDKMASSLAELSQLLDAQDPEPPNVEASSPSMGTRRAIPTPPAFYAEPDYIGSHEFVGRAAELQALNDWAQPADPTNLLLFEAIGGNGKSMLTWQWTTQRAPGLRTGADAWAGRFWYSFYERGAVMQDFCQRALAYMTGRPLEELKKKKTTELKEPLLAELHARPWLLILDGLERVLVAYHRIDAAEVPDEEANNPTDKIVNRNPCDAIRDEDNDLLRALAAAAPSKLLASSRLTPRVLLNPSGQPIPGARRVTLPGLRPPDAEQLLRSCGIRGDSEAIQSYLTANCDNHPLVIGVLAGLINDYLPDRGNFEAWVTATDGGAALNLASLDLIQRRNHILRAALDALAPASRQLLSTLALLSEAVDYETLKALNPHLPPQPEEVEEPELPENYWRWKNLNDEEKTGRQKEYDTALANWKVYEQALNIWHTSTEVRTAPAKLAKTVKDLEQRGLLQYDSRDKRHDLHPVVRGVAAGGMSVEDTNRYGQRVVDHFSSQPHSPYKQAETMEELSSGLHLVRILLKLGHLQKAADIYGHGDDLPTALLFNLEAYAETLSLLRGFFPVSWRDFPEEMETSDASSIANDAAIALLSCGEQDEALSAFGASLRLEVDRSAWFGVGTRLCNIAHTLSEQKLVAKALRVASLALDLATVSNDAESLFKSRLKLFDDLSCTGEWQAAEVTWQLLDPMGREWRRSVYRQGNAEYYFAKSQFWQGNLKEENLAAAALLAKQDNNRGTLRALHKLRGAWRLEQRDWPGAITSLQEAVQMARERRLVDEGAETGLALAKFQLGQLDHPSHEAERLALLRNPSHRTLTQLWLAIGDLTQAKHHVLAAYRWAWADGEPYVHRYELTQTTALLQQLNVPVPLLPPYDPNKDEPFPWEADVRAAIEKLREEKESEGKKEP